MTLEMLNDIIESKINQNENFIIFWDIIDKNINKKMYISGG